MGTTYYVPDSIVHTFNKRFKQRYQKNTPNTVFICKKMYSLAQIHFKNER